MSKMTAQKWLKDKYPDIYNEWVQFKGDQKREASRRHYTKISQAYKEQTQNKAPH